ncbi:metallophosphoesterase [Patescibacteria group bacterium]
MNKLVISDLHLGRKFNKRKFDYLSRLFSRYPEIILNGDFWDYYSFSFDEFVNSKWNGLFPIMKKKTVYIYGNHDMKKWSDDRVKLFSKIHTSEYIKTIGANKFIFRHGHVLDEFKQNESKKYVAFVRKLRLAYLGLVYDHLFTLLTLKNYKKIKKYSNNLVENELLVIGHKHAQLVNIKDKFISGGYIMFGKARYFELKNDGKIKLIKEKY